MGSNTTVADQPSAFEESRGYYPNLDKPGLNRSPPDERLSEDHVPEIHQPEENEEHEDGSHGERHDHHKKGLREHNERFRYPSHSGIRPSHRKDSSRHSYRHPPSPRGEFYHKRESSPSNEDNSHSNEKVRSPRDFRSFEENSQGPNEEEFSRERLENSFEGNNRYPNQGGFRHPSKIGTRHPAVGEFNNSPEERSGNDFHHQSRSGFRFPQRERPQL